MKEGGHLCSESQITLSIQESSALETAYEGKHPLNCSRSLIGVFWKRSIFASRISSESASCSIVSNSLRWTVQSLEFSRLEYRSGFPFSSPGDHPDPGIKPRSPTLQAYSLPAEPPRKPKISRCYPKYWKSLQTPLGFFPPNFKLCILYWGTVQLTLLS